MDRLLDPKNDWAFKQVFGEEKHKEILLKFLNDMLDKHVLHGDLIKDIQFLKVELDPEITALRQSIVDVLCKTQDGMHFIVEMQRASDSSFIQRAVEYASRVYLNQRLRSDKIKNDKGGYKKLRPVVFLAIMEETLFPDKKEYLSHHQFRDVVTYSHDLKQMSFSFLELSKFNKEFNELENDIEKWAYFFKNASHIDPDDLKKVLDEKSELGDAYKVLERSCYTPEQLLEYERFAWKEEEIQTRIDDAIKQSKEEGLAEGEKIGIEKGKAEGEKKAKIETARNLIKIGLSIEQISLATSLTVDEIETL